MFYTRIIVTRNLSERININWSNSNRNVRKVSRKHGEMGATPWHRRVPLCLLRNRPHPVGRVALILRGVVLRHAVVYEVAKVCHVGTLGAFQSLLPVLVCAWDDEQPDKHLINT